MPPQFSIARTESSESEDEHMSVDLSNKDLLQLKQNVIGSEEYTLKLGRYITKNLEE